MAWPSEFGEQLEFPCSVILIAHLNLNFARDSVLSALPLLLRHSSSHSLDLFLPLASGFLSDSDVGDGGLGRTFG